MLRHFHILPTHLEENDESSPSFESLPLMFSSLEAFKLSKKSFEQSMEKTHPDLLQSVFCTHRRDGEFKFCEAVKVDVSNASNTTKKHIEAVNYSNSVVKTLFEDIIYSNSFQTKHHSFSDKESLDLNATLFNKSKNSDTGYDFKHYKGQNDDMDEEEMQFFDLFELWSIFLHRSVHKTRLALLEVVAESVYGNKKEITKDLLSWFGYDDSSCDVMMKYMKWRIDNGEKAQGIIGNQLSFLVKFNKKKTSM
jgi:hypothetical protein